MNEQAIETTRTPEMIAGEIRTFTASMLNNVIEIGRRMVEVKKLLPYGTFGKWIAENTGYSSSTASNFMRLYQEYGADQGCLFGAEIDCQTFGKLSYSKALALLSVPKEERETVALEVDAEHLSTRELEKALAERDEARKQLQEAEHRAKEAEDLADRIADERVELVGALNQEKAKATRWEEQAGSYASQVNDLQADLLETGRKLKELESRPIEVAVERDEEAIQKAATEAALEAEKAASAELDKLRKKLEKAQAAQRKAEEERDRAIKESPLQAEKEKAEAAAESARQEAEALRKKLLSAESGANVAATLFSLAQQNFNASLEKVTAMKATHPDVAEKLLAGMETVLSGLVERIKEI